MNKKKDIVITVEGGLIQWIGGIPEDVRIIVHDYDVESVDAADLSVDKDGHQHVVSVWEKEDSEQ